MQIEEESLILEQSQVYWYTKMRERIVVDCEALHVLQDIDRDMQYMAKLVMQTNIY